MIVEMARVRIAGPREQADAVLRLLQDLGDLHLAAPDVHTPPAPAARVEPDGPARPRRMRQATRLLADVERALSLLPAGAAPTRPAPAETPWPAVARQVRRWRRELADLARRQTAAAEQQALLERYRSFFDAFAPLLQRAARWPDARASFVLVRAGSSVTEFVQSLHALGGHEVEAAVRTLPSGESAVLVLAAGSAAAKVEMALSGARLEELPGPPGLDLTDLRQAPMALQSRLDHLGQERAALQAQLGRLADQSRSPLLAWQARLHDLCLLDQAHQQVRTSELLFTAEGWMPAPSVEPLRTRLARELGPEIALVRVGSEPWTRGDTPVALANPGLFRPFEIITRAFPLPRYGSIDPTPFVAVFFPMFFGLMMGDVGYGLVLAAIAGVLRWRARESGKARAVAAMGLACALFAIVFGVLFGEFFGTLGVQLGMPPGVFNREHALAPFLLFSIALGAVHVVLGLVLALVGAWRQGQRRKALGRGLTIVMIGLTALALLAAFQVLPAPLFSPMVIAVLVAFPVLVALEGIIAVIELMSAFGHILSYARIMALGTASLMLAMIANQMVGAMGSALVGVAFALLFHLVNFAIGLFSPTIHALRLHYVEFFGEFYSPGGTAYRPLCHWRPAST